MSQVVSSLHALLLECARAEGFPLVGALDLDLAREAMAPHIARYDRWLQERHQGAMQYLERGRDRRADPRLVMPGAESILCVAIPYPRRPGGTEDLSQGPRYARYIHGKDYHDEIADGLERVMQRVSSQIGANLKSPLQWKVCVDSSAVLERSWAALAGLGWIGKNTLLIHPKLGSYLFLGEVLINQRTGHGPTPLPDYCGSCTRCLNACPTQAIREPHWVDANRCISYWTLEKRGSLELSEEQKKAIGPWIAGCDLCQEACPFNLKAVRQEMLLPPDNTSQGAEHLRDWESLLAEDLASYKSRVASSALSRVKPQQFSRNLAITLSNAANSLSSETRARLHDLARQRLEAELDETARVEWVRCVSALQLENRNP